MKLGKDFNSHEVGFINDQDGLLFSARDFRQKRSEGLGEKGDGKGTGLYLEGKQDLLEDFENRSGIGGYGKDPILRGMKGSRGVPEGSGFACSHLSRNDTDGAEVQGIEKSLCESLETGQRIKVLNLDILRERVALEAEEVFIATHRRVSFRRVFHPDRLLSLEARGDNCFAVRSQYVLCFV